MELSTQYVAITESRQDLTSLNGGSANLTDHQPMSEATFGATDVADESQHPRSTGSSDSARKTAPDNAIMFVRAKILCLVVVIVTLWGLLLLPIVIYFTPSVSHGS